jgi:transcriptional regulator with XRE-family HTH domain
MSQNSLAKRSGVSEGSIAQLEALLTGAQPRTVQRIADALGVSPLALLAAPASRGVRSFED